MKCLLKHPHPSKSEAAYCNWLYARLFNGEIKQFWWQHSLQLFVDQKPWRFWKADFGVKELDGTLSVHESKGWNRSDDSFRLKLSIALINYPSLPIFVNKRRVVPTPGGRIFLKERKKPKYKWGTKWRR